METPQHMFFVPALNSFHSGRKVKVEARKRFQDVNEKKPKLPGLFSALRSSKAANSPSPVLPIVVKKTQVAKSTPFKAAAGPKTAPRQLATPPSESKHIRATPLVPIRRPSTDKATTTTMIPKSKNVAATRSTLRATAFEQLPTPPPTPPLEITAAKKTLQASTKEKAVKIPRSNGMTFPKPTPIPRSKPAVMSKPDLKVVETTPRPTKKEERKAPASPPTSKPSRKVVPSSPAGKPASPRSKIPRTPTVTKTPAKPGKSLPPKNKTPTNATAEGIFSPAKVKEIPPIAIIVVEHKKASTTAVISGQVCDAKPVIETVAPVAQCEDAEEPQSEGPCPLWKTERVREHLGLEGEASKVEEAATLSSAALMITIPASPRKTAHDPLMDELKAALEKRKAAAGSWTRSQPKQEEPPVATQAIRTVTNAGSGIQARIAAMYASAGTSAPTQPTVVPAGARMRQFKRPELLDSDKASDNARIQREIEALRGMNKVGAGGAAIAKTRAFGGTETANGGAQETQVRALPLHLRSVVERVRRERLEEATQEK